LSDKPTVIQSWTASPPEDDIAAAGRFASNVSHEINNPLTVIMMGVSFLLEDVAEGNPLRRDIISIKVEAERIRALLRLLSDYSHTEIGDRTLVDLNLMISTTLNAYTTRIVQQGIKCVRRLSRHRVVVSADQTRLEQAFGYVIDNALNSMPNGGSLIIHTRRHDGQACVMIEDTGHGIHPDHLPLVFEPMFSTSNTTGMGLAFTRRIVKLLGGDLTVESAPEVGSTFTIALPLAIPR
jgi:signal transduction histidine kinase